MEVSISKYAEKKKLPIGSMHLRPQLFTKGIPEYEIDSIQNDIVRYGSLSTGYTYTYSTRTKQQKVWKSLDLEEYSRWTTEDATPNTTTKLS